LRAPLDLTGIPSIIRNGTMAEIHHLPRFVQGREKIRLFRDPLRVLAWAKSASAALSRILQSNTMDRIDTNESERSPHTRRSQSVTSLDRQTDLSFQFVALCPFVVSFCILTLRGRRHMTILSTQLPIPGCRARTRNAFTSGSPRVRCQDATFFLNPHRRIRIACIYSNTISGRDRRQMHPRRALKTHRGTLSDRLARRACSGRLSIGCGDGYQLHAA